MTTDEKVELARKISNQLVGVTVAEWRKWMNFVELRGLQAAIQMSKNLAQSPSLRSGPKRAYQSIHEAVSKFSQLSKLKHDELLETLGFVAWWLASRRGLSYGEPERSSE